MADTQQIVKLKKEVKQKQQVKKRQSKKNLKQQEEDEGEDIKPTKRFYIDDQASKSDNESITEVQKKEEDLEFEKLLRKPRAKILDINHLEQLDQMKESQIDALYEQNSCSEGEDHVDTLVFRVGCDKGYENESVFAITYKYELDKQFGEQANIFAAYAWKVKFPGAIFIETNNEGQVKKALKDIRFVRRYDIIPMRREFYSKMFQPTQEKKVIHILEGQWVRIKQHQLYHNDLGKVLKINLVSRQAQVKVIPRDIRETKYEHFDLPKTKLEQGEHTKQEKVKRISEALKQKMFSRGPKIPILVQSKLSILDPQDSYNFSQVLNQSSVNNLSNTNCSIKKTNFNYRNLNQERIRAKIEGFIVITVPLNNLQEKNFRVTPKEVLEFFPDTDQIQKLPFDIRANFKSIHGQDSVSMTQITNHTVTQDQPDDLPKFKQYDYVYVIDGEQIGQHGIILKLFDNYAQLSTSNNTLVEAHVLDLNKKNINVGMMDLKSELGFKKFDLVSFGQIELDVGCIQRISNNEATILDIHNRTRNVNLFALKELKSWSILVRGQVVEIKDGFYKGSQANVLQVYNEKSFLFNVKFPQSVIVEHQDNLLNLDNIDKKVLSNFRYQFLLGASQKIQRGPWQGYRGIITAIREQCATLQLFAKDQTVKVPLDHLDVCL